MSLLLLLLQEDSFNQQQQQEQERIIAQLQWEVNQLRAELLRMRAEDQMVIESLHNRIKDLEVELGEMRQIAESTTQVTG